MINEGKTVRFTDSVDVMSIDDDSSRSSIAMDHDSGDSDNVSQDFMTSTASTNRRSWSSSEVSFFSQNQSTLRLLDLTPTQPQRSLDCILTDALKTCEDLIPMAPNDEDFENHLPLPPRSSGLDSSLFSMTDVDWLETRAEPPVAFSSSCIVSQALKEIMR